MQGEQLNSALKRNIQMLGERRQREQDDASFQDRIAARITAFAGSMTFVFLHVVIVCVWLLMNSGLLPWLPAFDPAVVKLALAASVEEFFLLTFILMTQVHMHALAAKRTAPCRHSVGQG